VIFPTPVPPRAVLEFYEAVPEGIDMTTVSLTIQQLSDNDMDEAIKGMERAAKQLANFDVDVIYQSGVPPVVRRGLGFGDELADRLSQASGLPAITDMSSVIDAMRTANLKTLAMATPFEQFINDRLVQYLAAEKIEITNNTALGIKRTWKYAGCRSRSNTRWRARPISNRRRSPTASTFPAAAGAASAISSCSKRISTPPWLPG
jgi:maleate cis-trans isomerase